MDEFATKSRHAERSLAFKNGRESTQVSEDVLRFISFCIEMYARRHGICGADAMAAFDGLGVCGFLADSFDPLHSQDREEILDDIELFMKGAKAHGVA